MLRCVAALNYARLQPNPYLRGPLKRWRRRRSTANGNSRQKIPLDQRDQHVVECGGVDAGSRFETRWRLGPFCNTPDSRRSAVCVSRALCTPRTRIKSFALLGTPLETLSLPPCGVVRSNLLLGRADNMRRLACGVQEKAVMHLGVFAFPATRSVVFFFF